MGTCSYSPLTKGELFERNSDPKKISLTDFDVDGVIGKGGFGKVKRVRFKADDHHYAMKEMLKIRIIGK